MLKQNLPNVLTLSNLLCGCLAIQQLLAGNSEWVPWLIIMAGIFDFFDGLLARALNVSSPIGKDLDSLADMLTFGVLPSFMAFRLIAEASISGLRPGEEVSNFFLSFPASLALFIAVLSAFRLAKFNHDTRQTSSFIGMPTPANALFWLGLFVGFHSGVFPLPNACVMAAIALFSAFVLVIEVPMFSFKLKSIGWKGNEYQFILLILSVPLFLWIKLAAFAPCIFIYFLLSLIKMLTETKTDQKQV
jgi:CDP-diacylglycerol--serine O-phosphatidyltransferase